jgi:putative ABC transport system permease protein
LPGIFWLLRLARQLRRISRSLMLQEIRHSLRRLRHSPGFSATAILMLALGSGTTTAIFSIAYGVLLRDLPYDQPARLVALRMTEPRVGPALANVGAADYFDWRRRQQVFEDIALTRPVGSFNLTGAGEPERLQGARVTASLFAVLRARPLIGRTFTEEEQLDPARAAHVAVLSYGLWQRRFGGDPSIVGRTVQLGGQPHQIVGVMRPEFRYPSREFELWAPLYLPPAALRHRQDFSYLAVARLKPDVSEQQAAAHMASLATTIARENPGTDPNARVVVAPLRSAMAGPVRTTLWVLLAAVGTLFLIGCTNLAALLLARAAGRTTEFAVRAALGATHARLARQLVIEVIPLGAAGAVLAILTARWLLDILVPRLPAGTPRLEEIGLHGPVLLFSILLSVGAAFLVAIAPAWHVSTRVQRDMGGSGRFRSGLVLVEIACTVVLLVGAGLLARTFLHLAGTDPGFQPDRTLTLHLAVSRAKHGDDAGVARYLGRLTERIRAVAGVAAVGMVNRLPMAGQNQTFTIRFQGAGADQLVHVDSRSINGDYFRSLGVPLLDGRTFREDDLPDRPAVGIIDERLARQVFGTARAVGKRFRIAVAGRDLDQPWVEVVGVVGHLRHEGLDRDPRSQVYWPYAQRTQDRVAMTVRTATEPAALARSVSAAIREVDPDQAIYDVRPMREVVDRTLAGNRLNLVLMATFAVMALLLASVGLYAVVAQLTTRRRREFGIRMALGATNRQVMGLVMGQGVRLGAAGLALGLVLAVAATRILATMLHGVRPLDPITYAAAGCLLAAVVLAAISLPARRAMNLHPAEALRPD